MAQLDDLSRSLTPLRARQHAHCGHRDEPSELARRRHCSGHRAPSAEEARAGRGRRCSGCCMRWRDEATKAGRTITRIAVAFEAGRDGFWLARWLRARGIEAYVIHPTSVAVSREHRRAKTDRLDTGTAQARLPRLAARRTRPLQHGGDPDAGGGGCQAPEPRARGPGRRAHAHRQPDEGLPGPLRRSGLQADAAQGAGASRSAAHARGRAAPAQHAAELRRDMARLRVRHGPDQGDRGRRVCERLEQAPEDRTHAMVRLLARIIGIGVETADMLVHEVLAANLRDRRAVARYAGLTGSPDESGSQAARERARQGGQRPRAPRHDPARLALPAASRRRVRWRSGTGRGRPTPAAARARP